MGLLDEGDFITKTEKCQKCKVGNLITGKKCVYCDNEKCPFRYMLDNAYGEKMPSNWHPQAKRNASRGVERFIPLRTKQTGIKPPRKW